MLPEAEEVDIQIDAKDLRIDTFCSSGPGGQSVNTTYSAVRITHLPTNTVVSQQDEKSQIKNRAKAMKVLRSRLYEMELQKQQDAIAKDRRSQVGTGERSEKIRTYNFKENRVTDHRIGFTMHQLDAALDGDLGELIDAASTHFTSEKLKEATDAETVSLMTVAERVSVARAGPARRRSSGGRRPPSTPSCSRATLLGWDRAALLARRHETADPAFEAVYARAPRTARQARTGRLHPRRAGILGSALRPSRATSSSPGRKPSSSSRRRSSPSPTASRRRSSSTSCTGSGCLAITLAREFGGADIIGTDISAAASASRARTPTGMASADASTSAPPIC